MVSLEMGIGPNPQSPIPNPQSPSSLPDSSFNFIWKNTNGRQFPSNKKNSFSWTKLLYYDPSFTNSSASTKNVTFQALSLKPDSISDFSFNYRPVNILPARRFSFRRLVCVAIDFNENILSHDVKPNRKAKIIAEVVNFVKTFNSFNFLSTIYILVSVPPNLVFIRFTSPEELASKLEEFSQTSSYSNIFNIIQNFFKLTNFIEENKLEIELVVIYNGENTSTTYSKYIFMSLPSYFAKEGKLHIYTFERIFGKLKELTSGRDCLLMGRQTELADFFGKITRMTVNSKRLTYRIFFANPVQNKDGIVCFCCNKLKFLFKQHGYIQLRLLWQNILQSACLLQQRFQTLPCPDGPFFLSFPTPGVD